MTTASAYERAIPSDFGQVLRDHFKDAVKLHRVRASSRTELYRMTMRARGALAVKRVVGEHDPPGEQYRAMQRLHLCFPARDGCRAPVPILYLPEHQTIVMEWLEGRSLAEFLLFPFMSYRDAEAHLRRAATWIALLHSIERAPPGLMRHDGMMRYLDGIAVANPRSVEIEWVFDLLRLSSPALADRPTSRVRLHGDCKPENILISGAETVGLDFLCRHVESNAEDLGYFLVCLSLLAYTPRGLHLLSRTARLEAAFLEEYSAKGPAVSIPHVLWFRLHYLACMWLLWSEGGLAATARRIACTRELRRVATALRCSLGLRP